MKINEKVIWFSLGMILPIVIGGIFLLKKQIDSDSEPAEKYSMVPDIEVEIPPAEPPEPLVPEQAPPPVIEQTQKPATAIVAATESPANEVPETPPTDDPPLVPDAVPEKTVDSPPAGIAEKSVAPANTLEEKPKPVEPEPEPVEKPAPAPPTEYTLKSGDNPWVIAQKFGISTEELLKENKDLNPKNLHIGQVLKLPKTARVVSSEEEIKKMAVAEKPEEEKEPANGEFEWYTIKSGENPWTISRKLKVDHQQVMELNKELNFKDLKIGQKIKVPKKK